MAAPAGFEWLGFLQGMSAVEERVAVSAVILVLAAVVARLLAPVLARGLDIGRRVLERWETETLQTLSRYQPWWASLRLVVRLLQLAVLGLAALALLAVWGQLSVAVTVLGLASVSMPFVVQVLVTIVIFVTAILAMDVLGRWLAGITKRSEQFSRHQEEIAFRVLQIVVLTGAGLVALSLWGVDLGGLLIGAGFLGIVAGMAAQQTLGSLIAGFVLMFSRPFEIGDWVQIGDQEGIVTEITIVNTRLENFDGEFVVLPNDKVGNSTIVNRSMKGRLRIRVEVGIDYDADPERAQTVAVDALKAVEEILTVPRPKALTRQLADSSVVVELRFWIDKPSARRRAQATSAAIRAVKAAYEEAGIKIPYPQREVSDRPEAGGFRVLESGSSLED
jgi:small-conductance mechanosensitive channel